MAQQILSTSTRWATAAQVGLEMLYHYQPGGKEWLKRLERTLRENVIYCSNPKDFNDPWDCRPWFNTHSLDNADYRERLVQWFDAIGRKTNPDLTEEEHIGRANMLRQDKSFLEKLIVDCSVRIANAIRERYRVYCLSSKPDCSLMWAHYADKHRGMCLAFKVKSDTFCGAQKVDYQDEYPSYGLADGSDDENLKALLSKSSDWRYEDEYRVIAQERSAATSHETLLTDNGYLVFPRHTLQAIIVGCLMPANCVEDVKALIKGTGVDVVIQRSVRVPNRYTLQIASLDNDRPIRGY